MADSRELQILITAQNNAKKELDNVKKQVADLEPGFKTMATAGGVALASITAEATFALKAFAGSEVQMAKVNGILKTLSDTTIKNAGGSLDALSKSIDQVSQANIKLGFDDEDTAESLARLTQTTGDYQEALKLNAMAMDLARFKGVDLTTATSALMKMNSGSMKELKSLGLVVDENTTKEDAYRIVMEKTAGQAKLYSETITGKSEAMKIGFANLQEGIGQALAPAFDKLAEVIMPLIEKFSAWASENPKLLATILGIAGAFTGLITLVGTLGLVLPAITAGFAAVGAVLGAITLPMVLIVAGIAAIIAIGVLLYKHWDDISAKAVEVWNAIASFFNYIWTSITGFFTSTWTAITATITQVWTNITNFLSGVWTTIASAITTAWNAIVSFFTTIWDGIVAVVKFYLAFMTGLIIMVFKAMGIDIIAELENIKKSIQMAWDWIVNAFNVSLNFIINLWNTIWGAVSTALVIAWDAIKLVLQLAWDFITLAFTAWINNILLVWNTIWGAISATLSVIWEAMKKVLQAGWDWIKNIFATATAPLVSAWNNLWSAIETNVVSAWENIKGTIKAGINWVIDKINTVIRMANKVASMGAVMGFTPPKIPEIPMLAKGGIVNRPTLAMIGEAGPEAVVPLNRANGIGQGITINISGNTIAGVGGVNALADMIGEAIMNKLSLNQTI